MQYLQVKIRDANDTEPAYPEVAESAEVVEITPSRCAILQNGTANGKAAITFCFDLPDGKVGFMQFTEGTWDMVTAALRGAIQRWSGQ